MQAHERLKRLGWFLPLRLATYVVIMAVVIFWLRHPAFLQPQFVLYSLLTLSIAIVIAAEKRVKPASLAATLAGLQFLLEVVIETDIIIATGNIASPFSALFLLTIVSAALIYRLAGTLFVATGASVAYACIAWFTVSQLRGQAMSWDSLADSFAGNDYLFYSTFLHVLIFYLVAFVSGYLAERLSFQDKKLAAASRALKRARLETDDILRHLNSGLLTVDPQGYVIYFNRSAERILDLDEKSVKGKLCNEVFGERMPMLALALLDGLISGREHPRREIEVTTRAGNPVPVGVSTSVLLDEEGELRGVIAIFTDLTEAKEMDKKVRASDRMAAVGELSASIAHEIRNPLASISGSVEVLNKELSLTGDNARLMELIVKESHRLGKILTEFLTYARIDRPTYRKVDLCHVVSEVIELVRHHESYQPGITLKLECDQTVCYTLTDDDLTKQLLMNLALNACEAIGTDEGCVVFHVEVKATDEVIALHVRDNGPGVPEDHRDKIFQPFFSTKRAGTGLGLAIVHRIATSLKVPIALASNTQGTTFSLQFRAHSAGKAPTVGTKIQRQDIYASITAEQPQ